MSESESDEDYVPGVPEQLSEEDSADEETETQYESEAKNDLKRKSTKQKTSKKKLKIGDEICEKSEEHKEETKEKEEDLWSKFLDSSDKKSGPSGSNIRTCDESKSQPANYSDENKPDTKVFEFAGEKVVVQGKKVISTETLNANAPPKTVSRSLSGGKPRSSGGGLSAVLGQLGKKNKLSTLEKTKLDWDTYKDQEGIEEELKTFNKGKDGYLERQDFLERADLRQFEIEKSLRATRKSNR